MSFRKAKNFEQYGRMMAMMATINDEEAAEVTEVTEEFNGIVVIVRN